jgi:outer membrane protein OmpA-like peptidoglycan-associated protein/tetratricopeptide (TPR) repeat protein
MIKYNCICFTLLFFVFSSNAQSRKLEKAKKSFDDYNFVRAIQLYENLVKKGKASNEVYQNLGDANYLNANYSEASKWYEQLAQKDKNALDIEHLYRYAQSLRSIHKYEASDSIMRKLSTLDIKDSRVEKFIKNKNYLEKMKERAGTYTIDNLSINSPESDFAPSFRMEGLVFTTSRDSNIVSKNIHNWNKKQFLNLYTATETADGSFKNIMKFSENLNTKLHESSTAFTKDGKTVYFTRNNGKKGKFSRDKKGFSRLKIYRAKMINGKWSNIEPLPFNADNYSVAHPTLNKTEDKLYFSSDMPGSLGQSDIFVVDINADGSFGTPRNLGNKINTESKETFPFISDENILYFASDGHPGLGGLDIFATHLDDKKNSIIVNLGEPINSVADDFSLIFNSITNKGYFASNRSDGKGDDDIYAFVELKPFDLNCYKNISGTVKNKKTNVQIANAQVILYNNKNEIVAETQSESDGTFSLKGNCDLGDFIIISSKADHENATAKINSKGEDPISKLELLLLHIDRRAPIGSDLAKYLKIQPIYFDLDKWFITEESKVSMKEVAAYLIENSEVKVQIGSHTDARASKAYNMRLSNKRANSTMEYLIDLGIKPERLRALGFGETMITNECADRVFCKENKHQENRRSEFILIE